MAAAGRSTDGSFFAAVYRRGWIKVSFKGSLKRDL